jgi:hypothetical protein
MAAKSLVTGGVILAAALSLFGSIQYWDAETTYQHQSPDPYRVADQAVRLEAFRDSVPADAILGYLTDAPAEGTLASSMFFAAQYALAPRLLQKGDSYDLVLGNFTKPADFASVGKQHGLRVERDFGNGVVLFRREGAR